jgi:CMP-N,N'-diacetyllegionaminic acid synthase
MNGCPEVEIFVLARGGSKGIPGKNLRVLCGRPLVAWSLDYAVAHGYRPTLSTDSEQIAEVAHEMGLTVPRLRDSQLAEDETSSISTLMDAASWLPSREAGADPLIVLLEPTSPIRPFSLLPRAVSLLQQPDVDSVVSVVKAADSHYSNQIESVLSGDKRVAREIPEGLSRRRQELQDTFFPDGSIYASKRSSLDDRRTFYHECTALIEVTGPEHIDIDRPEDMALAEISILGLKAAVTQVLSVPGIDLDEYRWMFESSLAPVNARIE